MCKASATLICRLATDVPFMRAGIAADQSRKSPGITTAVVQGLLRWLAKIAEVFLRRGHPVSAEDLSGSAVLEAGAGHAPCDPDTQPTAARSCATALEVSVGPALVGLGPTRPEAQEIERRRDLVRTLFNDFWDGAHSKPG